MAEYKLTIKITGDDNKNKLITDPESSPVSTTPVKDASEADAIKSSVAWGAIGGMAATKVASGIKTFASNEIQKISTVRGDYQTAAEISNIMAGINMGSSIAGAAIAGATVGGPIGAAVGAAVGLAMQALTTVQNYQSIALEREYEVAESNKALAALGQISTNGFRN